MKRSKILSVLLAAIIALSCFSCLTVVSFAATVAEGAQYDEEGNLLQRYWQLEDTGVLTIYADTEGNPWSLYAEQIKSVVVKSGVTIISNSAFAGYPYLTSVTFEGALKAIEAGAFQNCDGLTSIVVPGTTMIEDYAFYDCDNLGVVVICGGLKDAGKNIFKSCDKLTNVEILNGALIVGEGMFEDCTVLQTAILPDSICEIRRLAFENCSALETITVPDSTVSLGEYAFYGCSSAKTAYIGHNVSEIGEYAFGECTSLESVEVKCAMPAISDGMFKGCASLKGLTNLPEGIKTIGKNAFAGCTSFEEIDIPATVLSIGDSAFDSTAVTEILIPGSVERIGEGVFTNCNALTAINVEAKNRNYASVDGVLYNSDITELICCPAGKTGSLTVCEGTKIIGSDAFIGCTELDTIEIPDTVTEIAANAFNGCADDLIIKANCDSYAVTYAKIYAIDTEVTHAATAEWVVTVEPLCDIAGEKEKQCSACGFVIETGIVDATGHNYDDGVVTKKANCTDDGVVTITCQNTGCGDAYTTTIPATGHNYDNGTVVLEPTCDADGIKRFRCQNDGCYDYYEIPLPATGHNIDEGTVKTEATCETDGEIEYKCKDEGCNYSYTEVIPATGHSYDDGVVTLEPICEDNGVLTYTCQNAGCGVQYTEAIPATGHNYDEGKITKYPTVDADGETTYTCKNEWCTEDCANHTYIVYIPNTAFDGILDTNKGAYVDENGKFQELTWLITDSYDLVIYVDGTEKEWASYKDIIKTVTIMGEATTVTNGSFAYMPALTEANILLSLGTIEVYAFQYCENLKTVKTGSIEEMQDFAFYACTSLESVDIYGGLAEGKVGRNIFLDCTNLSDVILRNGSLELGEAMFKGCSALEEITLPESLLVIGDSAFDGTALKTIRIPTDVKEIQKGVFTNCESLEEIVVDSKNDFYFSVDGVLYDMALGSLIICPAGKNGEVTVWDGTIEIAVDAFIGCENVTKVNIPNSVTTIADNAFNGCSEGLVIAGDCDSYGIEFALGRGIATDINHVASDVWQIAKEATCLEAGSEERVCSGCGYLYETVAIDALGHNYDNGVITTKATCETEGVVTFTCTRAGCDDSYTQAIPATKHNFDNGTVISAPNCEDDGTMRYSCQNEGCYDYNDVVLPATGHNMDKGTVKIPVTCTEDGETVYKCTNAGCTKTEITVISATGHEYESEIAKNATCLEDGIIVYNCVNCGDSYKETYAGQHKPYSTTQKVEPTCEEDGKEGQFCAICHEFIGATTAIPATGHSFENGKCTECGKSDGSIKPATPKLTKVGNTIRGPVIYWDAVKNADSYVIYSLVKGKWVKIATVDGDEKTSYVDTKAKSGTTYTYSVAAVNGSVEGNFNKSGLQILFLDDVAYKSIKNTAKGVQVAWGKVAGATQYNVYRRTASTDWVRIAVVSGTSYVDSTAKSGTGYIYVVRARNGKTLSSYIGTGINILFLATPDVKTAKAATNGVTVTWAKVSGAKAYRVYRRVPGGKWEILANVNGSVSSFKDKTAKSGVTYIYTVKAFNGSFTSAYEAGVKIKFLATPKLTSAKASANGITVKCSAVTGATSYNVYRKTATGWKKVANVKSPSYTDKNVKKGTTYTYTFKAVSGSYSSSYVAKGISCKAK